MDLPGLLGSETAGREEEAAAAFASCLEVATASGAAAEADAAGGDGKLAGGPARRVNLEVCRACVREGGRGAVERREGGRSRILFPQDHPRSIALGGCA
jgi:hypothetical protein